MRPFVSRNLMLILIFDCCLSRGETEMGTDVGIDMTNLLFLVDYVSRRVIAITLRAQGKGAHDYTSNRWP